MNRTGFPIAALLAGLLCWTGTEKTAEGCACCDGYSKREVLGWSKSGNSALVRMQDAFGCSPHEGLEVWVKNVPVPTGCFDLNGDPKKRVECDQLEEAWNREVSWTDTLPPPYDHRLQYYPVPARPVDPRHVQSVGTLLPRDEEIDAYFSRTAVSVQVLSSGTWVEVLQTELYDSAPEDPSGETVPYAPIEAAIYPSPSGDFGLLRTRGYDTMVGIGAFPEELTWISLPQNIGPVPEPVTPAAAKPSDIDDPVWGRLIYEPSRRCPRREKPRPQAVHLNTLGFREYNKKNWSGALSYFIQSLEVDADYALARFNTACLLSKLGFSDRALAQLDRLGRRPCKQDEKQLLKAATDEDLTPLRNRPAFKALIAAAEKAAVKSTAKATNPR